MREKKLLLNKKQEAFLKALKQIKDFNIEAFSSYLHPKSKCESTLLKNEYKNLQGKFITDEDVEVSKKYRMS
ncbi:hypothetical protein [Pseudobacteroides cellulosolvens]|uniref:hypothetical protein n=1 Tax=Pseudobacteroides cellulosolvens TaxID=35825 RepID=UPI0005620F93|nr:hypothetical protein [Pseudobacteroides cellulosolvens]